MMKLRFLIFSILWGGVFSYMMWTQKAPIVFAVECDQLKTRLAEASQGRRFLLITNLANDDHTMKEPVVIRDNLRFILQLSILMRFYSGRPVIQLDTTYTNHLSDENKLINSGHDNVVQHLNLVRGFLQGGIGFISHYKDWVVVENKQSKQTFSQIGGCVRFIETFSIRKNLLNTDDYYIGHAARVASYEKQMTRNDSISNRTYDCSSHFLWLENLSDHQMITHLSKVENPLGVVATDNTSYNLIVDVIKKLNPKNEHGKITILLRMRKFKTNFPPFMEKIQKEKHNVLWCCDPFSHVGLYDFLRIQQEKGGCFMNGVVIKNMDLDATKPLSNYMKTMKRPEETNVLWNRFSL